MASKCLDLIAIGRLVLFLGLFASSPALALSADLAKKCRDMSLRTYPYQSPGTGPGDAQNEIRFYKDCLAKGGKITAPSNDPADRR